MIDSTCVFCGKQARRRKIDDRSAHDVDCSTCGRYRIGLQRETTAFALGIPDRTAIIARIVNANARGMRLDISSGEEIPFGPDEMTSTI